MVMIYIYILCINYSYHIFFTCKLRIFFFKCSLFRWLFKNRSRGDRWLGHVRHHLPTATAWGLSFFLDENWQCWNEKRKIQQWNIVYPMKKSMNIVYPMKNGIYYFYINGIAWNIVYPMNTSINEILAYWGCSHDMTIQSVSFGKPMFNHVPEVVRGSAAFASNFSRTGTQLSPWWVQCKEVRVQDGDRAQGFQTTEVPSGKLT
jgi:hypothetical protein